MNRKAMIAVVAAVTLTAVPIAPSAARAGPPMLSYRLVDLGTFGGPNSSETQEFPFINNLGTVVGYADTATPDQTQEGFTFHAFRWRNGRLSDLGTLPGGANSVANVVNNHDVAAGYSETGAVDPESGQRATAAVKWTAAGRIVRLGTLGGNFGFGAAINDRGQIAGPAADAVPDPDSILGWPTRTRAFLWQDGVMRDLGTLGGPDAAAFFINQPGEVAGFSHISATPDANGDLTVDPFLWRHGKMTDLGRLGGTFAIPQALNDHGQVAGLAATTGNQEIHPFLAGHGRLEDLGTFGGTFGVATAVNNAGDVAGAATTPADERHGFFWHNGTKTDLGTIGTDRCSEVHYINARSQVTGASGDCDGNQVLERHGFVRQPGGRLIDLNAFVPRGIQMTVTAGETINDRGEIAGSGRLPNGDFHAVLLVPCRPIASHEPACRTSG